MGNADEMVDFSRGVSAAAASCARPVTRVLLVAPYAPRGGGMGRIMAYLAAHGVGADIKLTMVESRGGGLALWSAMHTARAAILIVHAALSRSRTIVHVNVGEGASLARKTCLLWLADALGLPTVMHLHAAEIFELPARLPRPVRACLAAIFRRAGICVVLGTPWQRWLIEAFGVDPSRIAIVHNGVPQPGGERCRAAGDIFTLAFLGNLLPRKGLDDLLYALGAMDPAMQGRWRLVVAGGGDERRLRRLATSLGIGDRVAFEGWLGRPAANALLRRADALVLPSHHEALPLVLLEAASLGVPVIATRVGAIPELFRDEHDALLVPPGDRGALSRAIARLIDGPAMARSLAENGKQLYSTRFTIDAFSREIGAIYAKVAHAA